MKKLVANITLAVLAVLLLSDIARATPSRQVWIPSPDTQPFTTFNLGVDTYSTMFRNGDEDAQQPNTNYGITAGLGLLPLEKLNLEVGVDMRDNEDPFYFNAKVAIPEDACFNHMPALAVGVYDLGTEKDTNDYNIIYGLVGKSIPFVGRFCTGYYAGNGGLLVDHNNQEQDNEGVLLSWDRTVNEISDRLWLGADYQGGNNRYGAFSFGASWAFNDNVGVLVGYQIYNDSDLMDKNALTVQVDVDF